MGHVVSECLRLNKKCNKFYRLTGTEGYVASYLSAQFKFVRCLTIYFLQSTF